MLEVPQKPGNSGYASNLLIANRWRDYELIETGDGMKLERWGEVVLARPDPQIIWPRREKGAWKSWDGFYHRSETGGGRWEFRRPLPESWTVTYNGLTFKIRPTDFKHTGLFPEQAAHWDWCGTKIREARESGREVNILNLFGYTGGATIAAAAAGAAVCHVDASKGVVQWCRENAALSGLSEAPIRYITDDCLKFVSRESRRGRKYDGIVLDPPAYGRGAQGEIWKIEQHLWALLVECRALLSDQPLFFILNSYTSKLSPLVLGNLLAALLPSDGKLTVGELALPGAGDGRTLPCGIYARWEAAL